MKRMNIEMKVTFEVEMGDDYELSDLEYNIEEVLESRPDQYLHNLRISIQKAEEEAE